MFADRRAVTGVIFAITTSILVGVVAIATEAGLWYLGRQQSYSVADAAAIAGVVAYAGGEDAQAAALALAEQNGFNTTQSGQRGAVAGAASSTVQASNPPTMGRYTDSSLYPSATEVLISVDFPTYILALFHAADISVGSRAVAVLQRKGQACLLSLQGDLTVGMGIDDNTYGTNCFIASNATDSGAVTFSANSSSGAQVTVHGISTKGGCTDCPTVDPLWGLYDIANQSDPNQMDRPVAAYQPPTTNPFATTVASLPLPTDRSQIACPDLSTFTNVTFPDNNYGSADPVTHCPTSPTRVTFSGGTVPPTQPDASLPAFASSACGATFTGICAYYNMDITLESSVTLQPGTYLLMNASLAVDAGATVSCGDIANTYQCGSPSLQTNAGVTGVNFVLAGVDGVTPSSQTGQIRIDAASSVKLFAASPAAYPPGTTSSPLNGVLFYRDARSLPADSASNPSVIMSDDGSGPSVPSLVQGIMYFPQANVWFAANALPPGMFQLPVHLAPCAVVVAGALNIGYWSGGASSNTAYFSNTCSPYGFGNLASLPAVQAAALVE